jgi:hypothetical protein
MFLAMQSRFSWRPIANCPGRFVLAAGPTPLPPEEIAGENAPAATTHRVPAARDPVRVVAFADGGLISYVRSDGTYVHTLNTPEGFARKLAQLGIAMSDAAMRPR